MYIYIKLILKNVFRKAIIVKVVTSESRADGNEKVVWISGARTFQAKRTPSAKAHVGCHSCQKFYCKHLPGTKIQAGLFLLL